MGYEMSFRPDRETRIAHLPVGYGDGYPRALSGRGVVLIKGRRAPVVGLIGMESMMVDAGDLPGDLEGREATLIGRQGPELITAAELARKIGLFGGDDHLRNQGKSRADLSEKLNEPQLNGKCGGEVEWNTWLRGAPVYVMDEADTVAQALVVSGAGVKAVGNRKELGERFPRARRVSLDGGAVIPAFNDCHAHLIRLGSGHDQDGAALLPVGL